MKNIVIAGLTYEGNLGDVALGECNRYAIEKEVKKSMPNLEVEYRLVDLQGKKYYGDIATGSVFEKVQSVLFRLYKRKDLAVTIKGFNLAKKVIDKDTIAVFIWGGIADYDGTGVFFYTSERIGRLCVKKNIPVMLLGIGTNSFSSKKGEMLFKRFINLSSVKKISVRDNAEMVKKLYEKKEKVDDTIWKVADLGWIMSEVCPVERKKNKVVGVCVAHPALLSRHGISLERQLDVWRSSIEKILAKGYDIKIFSNGYNLDYRFSEQVYEYTNFLDANRIILSNRPYDIKDYAEEINTCFAVISERMHAGILSYSYNVPFILIEWNEKIRFFCEEIGNTEILIGINEFCAERIVDTCFKIINLEKTIFNDERAKIYLENSFLSIDSFINDNIVRNEAAK